MSNVKTERARVSAILRTPGAERASALAAELVKTNLPAETCRTLIATATGTPCGRFAHLAGAGGAGLERWAAQHRAATGAEVDSPADAAAMARRGMPHLFVMSGGRA